MKQSMVPALLFLLSFACPAAWGQVHYHDSGMPWKHTTRNGPDAEVGGWYYNLGITGLRAELIKDQPTHLLIKYVFEDTPAHGEIQPDDVIVGANGKKFATPHRNGYSVEVFGGHGPIMDFGNALDESQGDELQGKLTVDVLREGKTLQVILDVPTKYGRYGKTFPTDCKKSDLILEELYKFLAAEQRDDGSWGPPHTNTFAPLALLASGKKEYLPLVKKCAQMHASTTKAADFSGLINWRYMAAGIVLSEYYLATKEAWVLPELQQVHDFLISSQYVNTSQIAESSKDRNPPKDNQRAHGGWGHNPGYEGYGPIGMTTGQGALVLALMHRCGIEIDRARHDKAYDFLVRGTGRNGYVWYADAVSRHDRWADMGRTGAAGVANFLSPYDDEKYMKRALAHARCIGEHPETMPDTHGSPLMGMGYTALAAHVDPTSFRKMMDSNRWWFTLSQCADGTFYYQPNRDNNPYDFQRGSRVSASAVVALVFSAKNKNLCVTGADRGAK
ncbi:MAG: PDZ domain-containing protein [Candidatus Nealsonbacteria bacterium]|nr:PDZ domain-containing protein [Candidatus Nealsonbacteria bacterium]